MTTAEEKGWQVDRLRRYLITGEWQLSPDFWDYKKKPSVPLARPRHLLEALEEGR